MLSGDFLGIGYEGNQRQYMVIDTPNSSRTNCEKSGGSSRGEMKLEGAFI